MSDTKITTDDIITAVTLHNAVNLSFGIIAKCAGNDIANQIGSESIETTNVLDDLIASIIRSNIVNKI